MKKSGYAVRCTAFILLSAALCALFFSDSVRLAITLPDVVYGGTAGLSGDDGAVQAAHSGDERLKERQLVLSVMGIPVRTVELRAADENRIIPGGDTVGIKMFTRGVLVVGFSTVASGQGSVPSPAQQAGLKAGDILLAVDDTAIQDSQHLGRLAQQGKGRVKITAEREGKRFDVYAVPVKDVNDNTAKIGIWARDSTAGVGTVTYYDPGSGYFGALGHPITDMDTGMTLSVKEGEIVGAEVVGITKGAAGAPGELKGVFAQGSPLGTIEENGEYGVFGRMSIIHPNALYPQGAEIATREQVHLGDAQILCTVDHGGVKAYGAKVIRVTTQNAPSPRGMVIEITDPELLKQTGGIVQGMSGSPILQDGKIIGAITHVFINDPAKGYGMYIEWMLQKQKQLDTAAAA